VSSSVQFASVRLITDRIDDVVGFYAEVSGVAPTWATPEFAELRWPGVTLAIASASTVARLGDHLAPAAGNRSSLVEFRVGDVDAEVARIRRAIPDAIWVLPPTTMPWGNRSALLRDPDGTLVNLFSPPAAAPPTTA
jgi:catechol 2,3-dioxygenase-like lactoylglutathione lyase family enzyme